jgi:hypothetical protein
MAMCPALYWNTEVNYYLVWCSGFHGPKSEFVVESLGEAKPYDNRESRHLLL